MPQVVQDNFGGLHIGARSGETQYLLDGFEIGDPVNNTQSARFNVDATRAAELQTGRIGAGYAHSGANVLSLETPDGDDKWRFGTTNPLPGINIQNGARLGNWYPRFTFFRSHRARPFLVFRCDQPAAHLYLGERAAR
jgi:hypothetical protein